MNLSTLLVFIPACFALNMAPGPNNLLSISNASRQRHRPWAESKDPFCRFAVEPGLYGAFVRQLVHARMRNRMAKFACRRLERVGIGPTKFGKTTAKQREPLHGLVVHRY